MAEDLAEPPMSADPELSRLRTPPASIEAESSVLGGLLLDNSAWDRVGDVIRPDDFYRQEHGLVFEVIGKLINGSKPADVITVFEELQTSGRAETVGGLQ